MDFFEDEARSEASSDHSLWPERYRPKDMSTYICDDVVANEVAGFIERGDIPHLLFHGHAGSGKTTLAKILASEIPCDLLYVNASDNTGIDFIRDDVKPFAASSGYHALKIVILDEADHLSHSSQAALRNLTETYSKSTRFILTCNFVERLIVPLISRLQVFELEPPSKIDAAMYLKGILDTEGITHTMSDIKSIINDFYPDIRKIVNYSQQVSTTGSIIHIKNQSAAFAVKQSLIKLIVEASKNATVFNDIRQLIADSGTKHFEELYHELYSRLGEYSNNNDLEVIITLAEYSFQNAMVVDKEITFMACVSKLISIVK
jgi:replication factor C small subunit